MSSPGRNLLTRDGLARRKGGVWDYISPSRLNTWLACPLKFKLKYIDGVSLPTSPAAFVGKTVHAGLEAFYRHRQLGLALDAEELGRRFADIWARTAVDEQMSFDTLAHEHDCLRQALVLLQAYLRHLPVDEPRPLAVEVAVEAPLIDPASGEDLGMPLVGVMDLILPDDQGPVIADFKTTARSGEPLEIAHEVQLGSYAYLYRHAAGTPEGGLEIRNLIKTKLPKVQFHRYAARDSRHFERLFSVIRAYLDDLHAGRFIYRPGLACMMCDFRGKCLDL